MGSAPLRGTEATSLARDGRGVRNDRIVKIGRCRLRRQAHRKNGLRSPPRPIRGLPSTRAGPPAGWGRFQASERDTATPGVHARAAHAVRGVHAGSDRRDRCSGGPWAVAGSAAHLFPRVGDLGARRILRRQPFRSQICQGSWSQTAGSEGSKSSSQGNSWASSTGSPVPSRGRISLRSSRGQPQWPSAKGHREWSAQPTHGRAPQNPRVVQRAAARAPSRRSGGSGVGGIDPGVDIRSSFAYRAACTPRSVS